MQVKVRDFDITKVKAPGSKVDLFRVDFMIGNLLFEGPVRYTKREILQAFNFTEEEFNKYLKQ